MTVSRSNDNADLVDARKLRLLSSALCGRAVMLALMLVTQLACSRAPPPAPRPDAEQAPAAPDDVAVALSPPQELISVGEDDDARLRDAHAGLLGFPLPLFPGARVKEVRSNANGARRTFHVALALPVSATEAASFYAAAVQRKGLHVERHIVDVKRASVVALRGTSGSAEAFASISVVDATSEVNLSWQDL